MPSLPNKNPGLRRGFFFRRTAGLMLRCLAQQSVSKHERAGLVWMRHPNTKAQA
jgi:hypothetical protein